MDVDTIRDLAISGLSVTAKHHRRWYFEKILEHLGHDLVKLRKELETQEEIWQQERMEYIQKCVSREAEIGRERSAKDQRRIEEFKKLAKK